MQKETQNNIMVFNGVSFGTHTEFQQDNATNTVDVAVGIEHWKRKLQLGQAWSQLQAERMDSCGRRGTKN